MECGLGPEAEAVLMLTIEVIQGQSIQMGWSHFAHLSFCIDGREEIRFDTQLLAPVFVLCLQWAQPNPLRKTIYAILGCWQNTYVYWRIPSNSQG